MTAAPALLHVPVLRWPRRVRLLRPVRRLSRQRAALVQAVILALWGSAGLTRYQTEMQAQRLSARRARPRRTARSRGTSPS